MSSSTKHTHNSSKHVGHATSSKSHSAVSAETPYARALKATMGKVKDFPKHKDPVWAESIALATDNDTKIALGKSAEAEKWLKSVFASASANDKAAKQVKIAARTEPKVWKRVQDKLHPTNGKDPLEGAYRAQSDWIAFRIRCGRQEHLLHIFDVIAQAAREAGGVMQYRLTQLERNMRVDSQISSNCDLYLPKIGYLIEIQIGTDFAFFMWCRDSYLRAHPEMKPYLPNYKTSDHNLLQVVGEAVVGKYGIVDKPLQQCFREFEAKNYKVLKKEDWMKERSEIQSLLEAVLSDKARKQPNAVFPVSSILKKEWEKKK